MDCRAALAMTGEMAVRAHGLPRFARNDGGARCGDGLPRCARNDGHPRHRLPRFARNDGLVSLGVGRRSAGRALALVGVAVMGLLGPGWRCGGAAWGRGLCFKSALNWLLAL